MFAFLTVSHFINSTFFPDVVIEAGLSSPPVQVCFNYHQAAQDDGLLVIEQLEPDVLWYNESLDVAVLQLKVPEDHELPPSLGGFLGDVNQSPKFHLIGHPRGKYKILNLCCKKRLSEHPEVEAFRMDPRYRPELFPSLHDPRKTLLEPSSTFGASGSPWFDDNGRLVFMAAQGLMLDGETKLDVAVNLIEVYRLMFQEKQHLADELFGDQGNPRQTIVNIFFYFFLSPEMKSFFQQSSNAEGKGLIKLMSTNE